MKLARTRNRWTERLCIGDAFDAYLEWRDESAEVSHAYKRWNSAPAREARSRFCAYRAALEREERAARVYGRLQARARERAETRRRLRLRPVGLVTAFSVLVTAFSVLIIQRVPMSSRADHRASGAGMALPPESAAERYAAPGVQFVPLARSAPASATAVVTRRNTANLTTVAFLRPVSRVDTAPRLTAAGGCVRAAA